MAASNSENSQATRELLAQLAEGHTKLSTEGSSRAKFWRTPRLPELIRKLILAASVSALDTEIPTEPNEEYKVFLESPKQHNRSILANALLGGSRSLPLLVDQQLADSLYNGQLQGFNNHKPGSLLLFHMGQSDNFSKIMSQLELELRLSSSTGLTNAKIEKLVKRTVRVAHDIPNLRAQLVDFLFTKESFLYSNLAIWIPFINRNLIQMSRTHLKDPKFIATLSTIIDRKFQGFLSHCTYALTAKDVRKFAFNFEQYSECVTFGTTMSVTLAPEVAFCIAQPPTPKSGSPSEKRKAANGTTPPPKKLKLSKPTVASTSGPSWLSLELHHDQGPWLNLSRSGIAPHHLQRQPLPVDLHLDFRDRHQSHKRHHPLFQLRPTFFSEPLQSLGTRQCTTCGGLSLDGRPRSRRIWRRRCVFGRHFSNVPQLDVDSTKDRGAQAALLALDVLRQPLLPDGGESLPLHEVLAIDKAIAKGTLAERLIVLGWMIDTRRLLISPCNDKCIACTAGINNLVLLSKARHVKQQILETMVGRLQHVANIMVQGNHFLGRL